MYSKLLLFHSISRFFAVPASSLSAVALSKANKYPTAQRVSDDSTTSCCMCCHRGNKEEREWKRQEKDEAYQAQLDVLKRRKSGAWQKVLISSPAS